MAGHFFCQIAGTIRLDLAYIRMPQRQKVMVRYLGSTGSAARFLRNGKTLT